MLKTLIYLFLLTTLLCANTPKTNKSVIDSQNQSAIDSQNQSPIHSQKKSVINNLSPSQLQNNSLNQSNLDSGMQSQNQSILNASGKLKDHDDCKTELLGAFGIVSTEVKAIPSTYAEKKFCGRNIHSCCNAEQIESVKAGYINGEKALRKQFQVMEELFSLFVGPAYDQVFYELRNIDKCDNVLTQDSIDKEDFFDEEFIKREVDAVKTLSLNLKGYLNRQLWFYRDLVCTICNPFNHKFFDLGDGQSHLTVHVSMCSDMYEIKDYEAELVRVFAEFILPFVRLVECSKDEAVTVFNLDTDTVSEMKGTLDECFAHSFNIEEDGCHEMCKKSLVEYKFPIEIFGMASKAEQVIYEKLTNKSINDFYELTRGEEWTADDLDHEIDFFDPNNVTLKQYALADVEWKIEATEGVSVFHNEMSKLFTKSGVAVLGSVVVGLIGLMY